jgi:hypothetical protein
MYPCSIDLKQLTLPQRNEIMYLIKKSRSYYRLENQVVSTDFETFKNIMREVKL